MHSYTAECIYFQLPVLLIIRHTGKVGSFDPTGCQMVIRTFLLACELGRTRMRGNDLSSGAAGVSGGSTRGRRERKQKVSCGNTHHWIFEFQNKTTCGCIREAKK